MDIPSQIQAKIAEAQHVLVLTHVDPDGDALGSLTAVGLMLRQLGKKITLAGDESPPKRFDYLPLFDEIQVELPRNFTCDLLIVVDCGDEQRIGRVFAQLAKLNLFTINIDHHITNTRFGQINLVQPKATSTAEMLYNLFTALGIRMTGDIAQSLLTGLVTDTLGFRTVGVTPQTLRISSNLMEAGADLSLIIFQGLMVKPLTTLQLWQAGLNNLKMEEGLVWASINNEQRKAIGYTNASSAGLVNLLSEVQQSAIGMVLLEMDDGTVRVGFRCNPPYSVAEVATNLGGGGHHLAAGCKISGKLPEVERMVVQMVKETIRQQRSSSYSNGKR